MRPITFAVLVAVLALPSAAAARPIHKQALAAHLGKFLPKNLNECRLCHVQNGAIDAVEMPRNPFGERLEALKKERTGKPNDIPARFLVAADEDSDGDGSSNLVEVLTGHFPGDKSDKPTAEESKSVESTVAKYRESLQAYAWRPFETVKRPPVPSVKDPAWGRNPIDAFVAVEHLERGLIARPEADRVTLLRRVTFDLTGLPPTAVEIREFVADPSSDAYENVVDRLLASPQYGERWGRHWLDVWRYSDWSGWTGGNQIRDSQPHIWRWRDWVVESLNADKGYDRMVVEMLAGDEIAPDDPATLRATGFLVRNFKSDREKWMQDTVDHTFLAFQALTVGCARCHDHMYDPIPQREYYQLRAVFEPHRVRLDRVPGEIDTKKDGLARAFDADPAALTYLYIRGDDRTPDKSASLPPGTLAAYGPKFPPVVPVKLPAGAVAPNGREFVLKDELAALEAAVVAARGAKPQATGEVELAEARRDAFAATAAADKDGTAENRVAASVAQRRAAVAAAKRDLAVAEATAAKDPKQAALAKNRDAAKAALAKAEAATGTDYAKRPMTAYPAASTGRRTALAKWLTDPANPLTARVAVNHLWLRHFGQAIVPSVFDFGANGRRPTHPALLDWLAAELVEKRWSMKQLHKLILTSRTYRSASTPDSANAAKDPDNLYLWRFVPRRLEAEAVRDQLLFVSGRLDLALGGPDLDPARGFDLPRRSLYFRHAHERQMEFLKLFDAPSVTECYQRRDSVAPQQALALANSPLAVECAKRIAKELNGSAEFGKLAFGRVVGRSPTVDEAAECAAFLEAGDAARRKELLVLALFSHHEFVTVR